MCCLAALSPLVPNPDPTPFTPPTYAPTHPPTRIIWVGDFQRQETRHRLICLASHVLGKLGSRSV